MSTTMPPGSTTGLPRHVVLLYRSLLRAHRQYLPAEMRSLGDTYVKAEFRQHTGPRQQRQEQQQQQKQPIASDEQMTTFCREWEKYLNHIVSTGEKAQQQQQQEQNINITYSRGSSDSERSNAIPNGNVLNGKNGSHANGYSHPSPAQFGEDLPDDVELSDEQRAQLAKLRDEASKSGGSK